MIFIIYYFLRGFDWIYLFKKKKLLKKKKINFLLFDTIIHPNFRKKGLSKILIKKIIL